jgi:DNA-binding LacI/PurR family transcriptional regulator
MPDRASSERGVAPTIAQVAEAASVSRATVSRAFGAPHLLSATTVQAVRAVAARLGYVPNQTARALSTGRTGNVALVVPDITNPFFAALMRGAQAQAREAGFAMFLGDSDELPALEDELLAKLAAQVEGFVLVSPRCSKARIRHHAQRRPLVLVNSEVEGLARLMVDTAPSYAQAVRRLAALGHRRLAYVAGPARSWSNGQRRMAVETEAGNLGVAMTVVPTARPCFEAGRDCAEQLVAEGITAALAFDDSVAQGIIAGLAERGLTVPSDVSVVGCDGVIAGTTFPALTSIDAHCSLAGARAVDLLLTLLRNPSSAGQRIIFKTDFVIRASMAPPPGAPSRRTGDPDRRANRQAPCPLETPT